MANNPRKFSEKIALHNQKQAEETAAFEQIMREVSDATAKVNPPSASSPPSSHSSSKHNKQQLSSSDLLGDSLRLSQSSLGYFRGGSLPNVSAQQATAAQHQTTNPKPDDHMLAEFGLAAMNNMDESLKQQNTMTYRESRGRSVGVGPMRSRPIERKDTSPYSSATYLSPPSDSSWRRTSSDSALHQSVQLQGGDNMHGHGHGHGLMNSSQRRDCHTDHMVTQQLTDGRPRSSCEVPRVPGINIYPSAHDPGAIQIPIGNNTGSLPDLTSVHFPSPLHTPLDQEPDHSSSPYSSSPVTASPTTLSPTSLPQRQQSARFHFSPAHSPQGGQSGHSPLSGAMAYTVLQDTGGYSPTHSQSQNHLSVPVNSRYLHHNKGVAVDNTLTGNYISHQTGGSQYNMNTAGLVYQHSPVSPRNTLHGSHGNINICQQSQSPNHMQQQQHQPQQQQQQQQQPQIGGYRSPGLRPSPGSSPGLGVNSGTADTGHSAPCSPRGSMHSAPYDSNSFSSAGVGGDPGYYISQAQAQALQQHFEQFSMDWAQLVQSLVESGCTWTAQVQMDPPVPTSLDYMNPHSPGQAHYTQSGVSAEDVVNIVNAELAHDPGYFSTSPSTLQYTTQQSPTPRQATPQTPNTPTSIPDIILTDFSSSSVGTELSKEINCAMSGGHFDHDLFPSDESLRDGLEPIDFDGLQMLTDPDMNVISDPTTEDAFRMDRL